MLTTEQRFWSKVDIGKPNDCWPWQAGLHRTGYGAFYLDHKKRPAHRVAWELANKEVMPSKLHACHICDNPPCCNPRHIFPGTPAQNIMDSVRKGRRSPIHYNSAKTHCIRGHEFTPENTAHPRPSRPHERACRTCKREAELRYYHRDRAHQ